MVTAWEAGRRNMRRMLHVCAPDLICTRFALWEKSSAMKDGSQQFLDTVKAYNERQAKKKWYEI
jgi:hypothetical protein